MENTWRDECKIALIKRLSEPQNVAKNMQYSNNSEILHTSDGIAHRSEDQEYQLNMVRISVVIG